MQNLRYPLRTLAGLGITALLSVYGAIQFYGEQKERNQTQRDPYKLIDQERRFAPVKEIVPPSALVGYVSDVATDPTLMLTAQYALAPRLIVKDPSSGWVIGNFARPQDFAAFARTHGLTLVKEFPDGVVLFRRSK
jgi:hypothetical protein